MGDRTIALLLGLATAASRLPFAAARLWEWDSVLYARALEHGFHVDDSLAASRPHPPGYVFYVASAALAKSAGLDSDHALVAISVLASGLAAAALYLFCRRVIGAIPSALVALAFACDPLVWLHGEVAMPYVLLAPLSTIIAATFLHARGRGAPALAAASVLFGILCGFRQDLLLFLFPLWLWLVLPAGWTARGAALAGLVAGCLAWFVPSALLSDGALSYAASVYRQLSQVSGVSGGGERSLAVNAVLLLGSLAWALYAIGPVLVVLVLARALAWTRRRVTAGGPSLAPFFALWLLPPFLFYALVHIGEWGFVLSLVPGLYAMFAWLSAPIVARLGPALKALGATSLAGAAVLAGLAFALGDDPVFSGSSLALHDRSTAAKTSYIARLPRDSTVVLAAAELLVARYYLPGYEVWYADSRSKATYERRLARPAALIVYEPNARPSLSVAFTDLDVARGVRLQAADLPAGDVALPGADIDLPRH